ncbi:CobQ/CobB/MinD/ParA nucleotide binding domain-containing protein [Gammaproteobacteria bacterium]
MSRLILVHGDKGGVGKSTLSRAVLDYLYRRIRIPVVYDADHRNSQVHRFYKDIFPVNQLDLNIPGAFDKILDKLAEGKKTADKYSVFVDLPAQAGGDIEDALSEMRFVDAMDSINARATVLFVMGRSIDSVNALQIAINAFGTSADYVVVKNGFFGDADHYTIYDSSPLRQTLIKAGAKELVIPSLWGDSYDAVDRLNLPFFKVAESELPLSTKARVSSWLDKFDAQFEKIDSWL